MTARNIAKLGRFHSRIPLWKQKVPQYPVYVEGNPQNRVLLCHFWMKMIKPEKEVPKNRVHFEVHPQMSKLDIKQYLEKIYKVSVIDVRVKIIEGKDIFHYSEHYKIGTEDDKKWAYVTLGGDQTFEFPDIFTGIKYPYQKDEEQRETLDKEKLKVEHNHWDRMSIPPWFR